MKKYFKWFGIALVLYAIFYIGMAIVKERYAPTAGYIKAQTSESLKDKKLNYTLNGVDFEIPLSYINGRVSKEGKQTGVRLIMTLVDMEPLRVSEQNFWNRGEQDQLLQVMVRGLDNYANTTKTFKEWAYSDRDDIGGQFYEGKEFDLEKYNDGDPTSSREDLYYHPSDKNIETHIRCGTTKNINSRCIMSFENSGLRYQINVRRKEHLQNWKRIKQDSINLINSFIVNKGK